MQLFTRRLRKFIIEACLVVVLLAVAWVSMTTEQEKPQESVEFGSSLPTVPNVAEFLPFSSKAATGYLCTLPSPITTGYDSSSATCTKPNTNCTGVKCATSYTGMPVVQCLTNNSVFTLTGCTAAAAAGTTPVQETDALMVNVVQSSTGFPPTTNFASLTAAQLATVVSNLSATGTKVYTSPSRVQANVVVSNPPKDANGNPLLLQRSSTSLPVQITSYGDAAYAIVAVVGWADASTQLGWTVPTSINGVSTLQWVSDVLSFTRLSAAGNLISSSSSVTFSFQCNNVTIGVCRFDSGSSTCNELPSSSIVFSGTNNQWCSVTSSQTSSFLAYVAPATGGALGTPALWPTILTVLMVAAWALL